MVGMVRFFIFFCIIFRFFFFFFFSSRRRHTRWNCDWSSDVCSSDLLKRLCALTDGNLSRHLDVLQEAGLVEAWRGTEGGRPQTLYRLTPEGRARFRSEERRVGKECRSRWSAYH